MSNEGALAKLDDDAAIAEIAAGTLTITLAQRYGIPKSTLRDRLVKHPQYPSAVRAQAESLVESATAEMMSCDAEQAIIARARARVDAAHKWAAARDAATWAPKGMQLNVHSDGPVTVQVVSFTQQIPVPIDGA